MKKIWSKILTPGEKWSGGIGRNKFVRFRAMGDGANLSVLLYNLWDKTEKYNMPDTLKAQHTAHLTACDLLLSDNGRVLAAFVQDDLGWHDTISGHSTRSGTDARYGKTDYQHQNNAWLRCGEENFKVELVRNGLTLRDITPCVNLFSKVYVTEDGSMHYDAGHCKNGNSVTLKTEMNVLFVFSNTPNPLNDACEYPSAPVLLEVYDAPTTIVTDPWVTKRPEGYRAYENTFDYFNLLGEAL
jgi:urea carboxylase-associated protein 2